MCLAAFLALHVTQQNSFVKQRHVSISTYLIASRKCENIKLKIIWPLIIRLRSDLFVQNVYFK
jgi:hypothetical protein